MDSNMSGVDTQLLLSCRITPFRARPNASGRLQRSTINCRAKPHARRKFPNTQDEELARKKRLYLQKRTKQREELEQQTGSHIGYLEDLDVKECMLEVQADLLGKLAADENNLKGLAKTPELTVTNFEDRVKEVEEAIAMLRY
jgi:hypothetical protein